MPLFEYRCDRCKGKFTLLVGVTAKKEKQVCPKCGSRKITKLISRVAAVVREGDFDSDFGGEDLPDSDDDLGDDDGGDYDDDLD
ncbi:MAG: zinc ribbon domain-containing protein [Armatimonadota bacterium]